MTARAAASTWSATASAVRCAPPNVQARASVAVAAGEPVLLVACDPHGVWHLCASATGADDLHPASPGGMPAHRPRYPARSATAGAAVLAVDVSLHQLQGLLPGWIARRERPGGAWTRSPA